MMRHKFTLEGFSCLDNRIGENLFPMFFFSNNSVQRKAALGEFCVPGVWWLRSTGSGRIGGPEHGTDDELMHVVGSALLKCTLDDGLSISFCSWILRYSQDRFVSIAVCSLSLLNKCF